MAVRARAAPMDPNVASGRVALDMLLAPRSSKALEKVETLLARQGIAIGPPLGAGGEAAVFEAGPYVVKLSADPMRVGPYFLPDMPGVAPYVYSDKAGPFRIGVQPRAAEVASPAAMAADEDNFRMWRDRSDTVFDVLKQQGQYWDDAGPRNVGLMPDGNLAAIDGWLKRIDPQMQSLYGSPVKKYPTTEDAIRALRVIDR
jgi:hypothetical protein